MILEILCNISVCVLLGEDVVEEDLFGCRVINTSCSSNQRGS